MKRSERRWEVKLGRTKVLTLMAAVVLGVGYFWPAKKAPVPALREVPLRKKPVVRRPLVRVRPTSRPVLTLAQRRKRKEVLRKQLFSGEFSLQRFPRKYRNLVQYKIREFQVDCELDQRCVKEQLKQALKRAGPSLQKVRAMLKQANIPPILLYLNFAESLWDHDVRSRAGAYGVCQFMPNTARWMGFLLSGPFSYLKDSSLRVLKKGKKGTHYFGKKEQISVYSDVYLYDQRRDVFTAIAKKIEYLKALKKRYSGNSWILAAFRYNFGPGNIRKIMSRVRRRYKRLPRRKRTSAKLIWMFLRSNRNKENYHYVANIMAFAHILSGLEVDRPAWVVPKRLVATPFQAPIELTEVFLRKGETISKVASRHKVTVRAVLKATQLSVGQASRLHIGARINVPVPKRLFLTPRMVRKHLGVGMEFYDWNPGIHDPRTRIKKVDYKYTFLYKVQPNESFRSIVKKFKHRKIHLRRLLRDNLTRVTLQKALRKRKGKRYIKAGTLLRVRGRMKLSWGKSQSSLSTPKQRRHIERTMPPIPGGWVLYAPPRLVKQLQSFLKQKIQAHLR